MVWTILSTCCVSSTYFMPIFYDEKSWFAVFFHEANGWQKCKSTFQIKISELSVIFLHGEFKKSFFSSMDIFFNLFIDLIYYCFLHRKVRVFLRQTSNFPANIQISGKVHQRHLGFERPLYKTPNQNKVKVKISAKNANFIIFSLTKLQFFPFGIGSKSILKYKIVFLTVYKLFWLRNQFWLP